MWTQFCIKVLWRVGNLCFNMNLSWILDTQWMQAMTDAKSKVKNLTLITKVIKWNNLDRLLHFQFQSRTHLWIRINLNKNNILLKPHQKHLNAQYGTGPTQFLHQLKAVHQLKWSKLPQHLYLKNPNKALNHFLTQKHQAIKKLTLLLLFKVAKRK